MVFQHCALRTRSSPAICPLNLSQQLLGRSHSLPPAAASNSSSLTIKPVGRCPQQVPLSPAIPQQSAPNNLASLLPTILATPEDDSRPIIFWATPANRCRSSRKLRASTQQAIMNFKTLHDSRVEQEKALHLQIKARPLLNLECMGKEHMGKK